ncbi:MAG: sigma-54-dependent Fis family transcriptional regulator [Desulfobulbaceae bacterium]|nr:sigma-54-dependent Fis family transcriptional regulator [Desulfobulbaceae bacterium]
MKHDFTILAIDDDPALLRSLKRVLFSEPYRLITTTDPKKAFLLLEQEKIGLVLLDLKIPGYDGMTILHDITSLYPDVTIIMLTGHGGVREAVEAIKIGAADFLEKPCPPEVLCQRLAIYHIIWQEQQERREKGKKIFSYPGFIGESSVIEELKSLIVRVAASDATVLIQGESGTGKELVARAVHYHSVRKSGPFVPVDCAAISENILESEFFGHERGAFTGADTATKGLIRSAEGGTLFLDEIGELTTPMQAKLLRTLQEREVRPVGSAKNYPVNIRVLAATNRSLAQETAQGCFRSDLFYRLSAISLDLPPLRDRGDDISLQARYFIARFSEGRSLGISQEALELLHHYSWPGNVRELENVIRRAVALTEQEIIGVADLPATIVMNRAAVDDFKTDKDSLNAYERVAFEKALKKTGNNKRQAAALLGISEATLYRKLKQFNLSY